MRTQIFVAMALAVGLAMAGCDDEHYYCGDGTEEINGACIGGGGECGPGTHEEDGQCVLDDDVIICGDGTEEVDGECVVITDTGLPPELLQVTSPTPYPGGGLMILIGDNFMLSDSGPMIVNVDGVPTTGVQVLSNTYAIADLPASTVVTVTIEIVNDLGDDDLDFHYTGLYAAEGGCWGASAFGPPSQPELHIVDPRNGAAAVVGPVTSAAGTVIRPVTAMAFDAAGTLWAVEAVCRADAASLMTIDRNTGAATVVATITVEAEVAPSVFGPPPPVLVSASITDIEFIGTTLYGSCRGRGDLCTIDTATGATTPIDSNHSGSGGGLAAVDDGTLLFSNFGTELESYQADGTYLGYASMTSPAYYINGLTWLDGGLVGSAGYDDLGLYRYDYANDQIVALGGGGSYYDAVATPPELDGAAGAGPTLEIIVEAVAHVQGLRPELELNAYEPIVPAGRPVEPTRNVGADEVLAPFAVTMTTNERGRREAALADLGVTDRVTFHAAAGEVTLRRGELASHRLVENRRGQLKLVGPDGSPVLRGITSIEAR